jgi:hypothetical protein
MMVLALLLCPAVNRVIRVQRIDQSASYSPSFQRSLDVPPQPHVQLPDSHVILLVVGDLPEPGVARFTAADEALPPVAPLASPPSPRAPPASI